MTNYLFHYMPLDNQLLIMDKNKRTLVAIRRSRKSEIYVELELANGEKKETVGIDEVLDLLPDATIQDLKNFAGFIYLFARG